MSDPISPLPAPSAVSEFRRPVEVFVVRPPQHRYWLHLALLLATFFSTLVVGARMQFNFLHRLPAFYAADDSLDIFPVAWALRSGHLLLGVPFSLTLMLILLAHEMGHYLYCRHYRVWATLPFFIPFPTLIGTLGAFIRIRSPIRSRSALFDIGIAGPIAGFVVAVCVLALSLGMSQAAPPAATPELIQLNYPLVFQWMHSLLSLLAPAHSVARLPLGQVYLHPVAIAAWVGMFATALNLLPGGQLDGGHIVFSIAPRAHRWVSRITIAAMIPLAVYCWLGWILWAVLLAISGMRHPSVPRWPGVDRDRYLLAFFGLVMLVVTITPAPFAHSSLIEFVQQLRAQ